MESKWIRTSVDTGDVCPVFRKQWRLKRPVKSAKLELTALGTYVVRLNGEKLGRGVLAPGWTSYSKRLQVQTYDLAGLHDRDNELTVTVGRGWCSSPMPGFEESEDKARRAGIPRGIIGCLSICYDDDTVEALVTDETWEWTESGTLFSEIYDGESMDARVSLENWHPAVGFQWPKDILIPQEGELITEQERIRPRRIFQTPKGETVVDFGQEITGYVALRLNGKAGQTVRLIHGETLDADGNFYHSNYRTAKAEIQYICRDGYQEWHPELTFFGFRYVKVEAFPGSITSDSLQAVVVCSEIKRTGWLRSGDTMLNRLFSNIFWGQRGNFLDVPTDCPQRDERLGWTGDAQVFVKTASYNYDSERFFRKWLRDLKADQRPDGAVGQVIPDYMPFAQPSAVWGDAAVICPWQIYQTYGDIRVLEEQYTSMKAWVEYISNTTTTPGLWTGGTHFGDWLALDAPEGSKKGATREDFIASAFYAHSTRILVQAGKELGEDVSRYERQYERIVQAFRRRFPDYRTQTECVLAVQFGLAEDPNRTGKQLAQMIRDNGGALATGFVGTSYLLHALSKCGEIKLAFSLLLRREYPGWLYSVQNGATTVWEHWDGIRQDGSFWSDGSDDVMNSLNHYAYGAVAGWVYEVAAGIQPLEPGFRSIRIAPHPDERLGWLDVEMHTRSGAVRSAWYCENGTVRYEITTPVKTVVALPGYTEEVGPGSYIFWGDEIN